MAVGRHCDYLKIVHSPCKHLVINIRPLIYSDYLKCFVIWGKCVKSVFSQAGLCEYPPLLSRTGAHFEIVKMFCNVF